MTSRSGEELNELDARQEPRLVKALEMVAPGSLLREGIDNIVHARTGGLIVIGDPDELAFLFSGGIKLDIDYSPQMLYQLAKMDGAIVVNANATKIAWANTQLMPDPTILTSETGTRHRTAERVSKQTDAIVIAVSQRREVVSLYVDGGKYILEDIPVVLAKANQALATLDKYRTRLDQVSTRLTALEFEGGVTLHDVLTVLQRAELVTRMAVEIERYIVELGTEGRLIEMQLEETMVGVAGDKAALLHDYLAETDDELFAAVLDGIARLPAPGPARLRPPGRAARLRPQGQHARLSRLAPRLPHPRPHPAPAQARGAEHRPRVPRAGRDPRRHRPGAGDGGGRGGDPREGHPRGPAPAPGDQPRGPLPADVRYQARYRHRTTADKEDTLPAETKPKRVQTRSRDHPGDRADRLRDRRPRRLPASWRGPGRQEGGEVDPR